jgi:protein-tyrosine phosphatase
MTASKRRRSVERRPSGTATTPEETGHERPFEVLVVCHANVCRSPMAEHLLRAALEDRFGAAATRHWRIRSGGTHVTAGSMTHELALKALAERGIHAEPLPALQVGRAQLDGADLVLTASREQRAWVVETCPSAVRRTFALRQFARLCAAGRSTTGGVPARTGPGLLRLATWGRAAVQPVSSDEDLVDDPIGGGLQRFRSSAQVIDDCVGQILG